MALRISREHDAMIREHGARDYPNECCGLLLGRADNSHKQVVEVVALKNVRLDAVRAQAILPLKSPGQESGRNRFLIDPVEQLQVEKEARARGLDVMGYYHSHPDHPAQPSEYDRQHAWPWYSYLILSVEQGEPRDLTCWVLTDDQSRFDPEPFEVVNSHGLQDLKLGARKPAD